MPLHCGTAKKEITPQIGTNLAGYMKERKAVGIDDPLYTRVFVFSNENDLFIMINLDLVGIDSRYVKLLTNRIWENFSIPKHHVFVHATHTHSGPGGIFDESSLLATAHPYLNGYLPYTKSIVDHQHNQILAAIDYALKNLEICEVKFGEGFAEGIATNRNNLEASYDHKVSVITFTNKQGEKAIMYHFACHPTILNANNVYISADFPGEVSKVLEERSDVNCAMFINGPSADISTRFTRKASTFQEVERIGGKLAQKVIQTSESATAIERPIVRAALYPITLQMRDIPHERTIKEELKNLQAICSEKQDKVSVGELRRIASQIEGANCLLQIVKNVKKVNDITTVIQLFRIKHIVFVGIPGEFYFESGEEIANYFDFPLLFAGNTNDQIGYIVPKKYWEKRDYEAYTTLLAPESEEKIKQAVREYLYLFANEGECKDG